MASYPTSKENDISLLKKIAENTATIADNGGVDLDTDPTLSANSDEVAPSQKAVKAYADSLAFEAGSVSSVNGMGGAVILTTANVADSTDKRYSTEAEKTKLAGIATGATANDTDANLKNRANHTGTQSADTIVDGTINKVFTDTEKIKLAAIAQGATANDTDNNLKNRANHTGTQTADTITDGTTNKVYTATEKTKLAGIATGATANSSDAALLDRANHTGTQSADTIVDGTTNVAFTAVERTKLAGIEEGATAGGSGGTRAQIILDGITELQSGKDNYDTISGDTVYTHVSATNGTITNLNLIVEAPCVVGVPACRRIGSTSTGLIEALEVPVGTHEFSFKRILSQWWLVDSCGAVTETPYTPPDITAPTRTGAVAVNTDGDEISVSFSENIAIGAGGSGGWDVDTDGDALTLAYASGAGTSNVKLTPSRTILQTETLSNFRYVQPGAGVTDVAGNELASFSGVAVTNNSTQTGGGGVGYVTTVDPASTTSDHDIFNAFSHGTKIALPAGTVTEIGVYISTINAASPTLKVALLDASFAVLANGSFTVPGIAGDAINAWHSLSGLSVSVTAGTYYIAYVCSNFDNSIKGRKVAGVSGDGFDEFDIAYAAFPTGIASPTPNAAKAAVRALMA